MGHQPSSSLSDAFDRYTESERIELEAVDQQRVLEAPTVNQRGNYRRHRRVRSYEDPHRNFQQPTSRLRRRNRRQSREVIRERDGIPVIELSDSEEGGAAEPTETNQADEDHMITRLAEDEVMALAQQMLLTAEESDLVSSPSPCSSVGSNDPVYDEIDEIATQDY